MRPLHRFDNDFKPTEHGSFAPFSHCLYSQCVTADVMVCDALFEELRMKVEAKEVDDLIALANYR